MPRIHQQRHAPRTGLADRRAGETGPADPLRGVPDPGLGGAAHRLQRLLPPLPGLWPAGGSWLARRGSTAPGPGPVSLRRGHAGGPEGLPGAGRVRSRFLRPLRGRRPGLETVAGGSPGGPGPRIGGAPPGPRHPGDPGPGEDPLPDPPERAADHLQELRGGELPQDRAPGVSCCR